MRAEVQKWGNSLAIRIPKVMALEAELDQKVQVDLAISHGKITITPVKKPKYSLDGLLSKVKKDNIHAAVDSGTPQGIEIW